MTSIPSFIFSDVVDDAGFDLMFLTVRWVKTCGVGAGGGSKCDKQMCPFVYSCVSVHHSTMPKYL